MEREPVSLLIMMNASFHENQFTFLCILRLCLISLDELEMDGVMGIKNK